MNKSFKKNISLFIGPKSGFSIVETIVAIAILSVAVIAPLTLAQRSLHSSIYARDEVTAFYLAQEAIEYVRYVRDSNNLSGRSQSANWLNGLNVCINNDCGFDVNTGAVVDCNHDHEDDDGEGNVTNNDCQLTFNPNNGLYGNDRNNSGAPNAPAKNSQFKRKINIAKVSRTGDPHYAADVAVTVSWSTGKIAQNVVVRERIFDWYPAN